MSQLQKLFLLVVFSLACSDSSGPGRITDTVAGNPALPAIEAPVFPLRNVIAYVSNRYGEGTVHLIGTDGSNRKRITAEGFDCATISPTGNAILLANGASVLVVTGTGTRTISGESGCPTWSPDGSRFVAAAGNRLSIYSVDGVLVTRGTLGDNIPTAAWSPDGNSIIYTNCVLVKGPCAGNTVNVVPANTLAASSSRVLASGAGGSVSPDGNVVAYVCGTNLDRVCTIPFSGGAIQDWGSGTAPKWSPVSNFLAFRCGEFVCTLSTPVAGVRQLLVKATDFRWSPDGLALAVTWGRLNNDIHLVNIDGTNLRNLTADRSREALGSWAPVSAGASTAALVPRTFTVHGQVGLNENDIVYQSTKSPTSLFAMKPLRIVDSKGTSDRRLLRSELGESCPSVSPDRKSVAFESLGIWVAAVDGSGEIQISDSLVQMHVSCPVWSADNRYIAFVTGTGLDMTLWASSVDTPSPVKLAHASDIRHVVWTPDGQSVLYFAEEAPGSAVSRLQRVSLTGASANFGPSDWRLPSFSSTGKLAVQCGSNICTAESNGDAPKVLTNGTQPLWSPNGADILFRRTDSYFVMAADGSNLRTVVSPPFAPSWASWSPRGDAIAFEGNNNVNVVRLDGSFTQQITQSEWAVRPSWTYRRWGVTDR
jgi:Tol biopolymer transport system component